MITVAKSQSHQAICRAIKTRRTQLRITQKELGERLGVGRVVVTEIEAGRNDITLSRLCRVADALDISLAELVAMADSEASEFA